MAITLRPKEIKELTEWHKRHFRLGVVIGFCSAILCCSSAIEFATGHWIGGGLTLLMLGGLIWFHRIDHADYYPDTIKFMLTCVELNQLQDEIERMKAPAVEWELDD